jgi:hypothetical protein
MLHDNIYRYTKRGTTNNNAILALAVRRIPPAAPFRRSRARARLPPLETVPIVLPIVAYRFNR